MGTGYPKHVENRKLCAKLVIYKELYIVHKNIVWKKEEIANVKPGGSSVTTGL